MKLLHIDSSIMADRSTSRAMTTKIVAALTAEADCEVIYRDLAEADPPHVTVKSLPWDHPLSAKAGPLDDADRAIRNDSQEMLDEFLAADSVVIGAPMYNFGIPTQLKAWIDRIVIPNRTFRFKDGGMEGLAGGKRVVVAITRGWAYAPGSALREAEHVESYLRATLAFIGLDQPEFIVAEGLALGDESRETGLAKAEEKIHALAA